MQPLLFLSAAAFLIYWWSKAELSLLFISSSTDLLLVAGGVVAVLPMLLFAKGAPIVPLSAIGVLQYVTPTMTLLLGIFVYHEPFSSILLISFSFIWTALVIFTFSQKRRISHEKKYKKGSA
ncbi:hypothetical protein QYG89_03065 [Bacillus sp. B190/17]|uniref:EamA domain-containing protein n=1 Tax=Bacillus lumedeiriae TaxID=3058829 RepID=A0ABW8I6R2_9BACI